MYSFVVLLSVFASKRFDCKQEVWYIERSWAVETGGAIEELGVDDVWRVSIFSKP